MRIFAGYRPILDAMKSLATTAATSGDSSDIEVRNIVYSIVVRPCMYYSCSKKDLGAKGCPQLGMRKCDVRCGYGRLNTDPQWYCPSSLQELSAIYKANQGRKIKVLVGDTGRGTILLRVLPGVHNKESILLYTLGLDCNVRATLARLHVHRCTLDTCSVYIYYQE